MTYGGDGLTGYYPPLEEFERLSRHANLVPVYREIDGGPGDTGLGVPEGRATAVLVPA